MDLWTGITTQDDPTRSSIIGYTETIGGIGTPDKYSVVEYAGFNNIITVSHELGHKLKKKLNSNTFYNFITIIILVLVHIMMESLCKLPAVQHLAL